MHVRFSFRTSKITAVLTVAVSAMVTLPVLLLPVGVRDGAPAYVVVNRAYAAAYPYDPTKQTVLVEKWAITGSQSVMGLEEGSSSPDTATVTPGADSSETATITPGPGTTGVPDQTGTQETSTDSEGALSLDGGIIEIGEGQTVSASYFEGSEPAAQAEDPYSGILTATIVQHDDTDGRPIEILAPETFLSDDTTMYVKTSDTILKDQPDMAAVTIATINTGKAVTRIGIGDTWAKVRLEDGTEGYLPQDNLQENMVFVSIERTVWVDADGLKLRASPSTDAEVLKTLSKDTKLLCSAISDKWYKVVVEGTVGYVYVAYTTRTAPPTPTPVPKKSSSSSSSTKSGSGKTTGDTSKLPTITGVNGESIVNICVSMLGVPYDWAGESRDGVDCSGLVVYAYRQIGIGLPHQSNSLVKCGVSISRSDIAVGDIVCWDMRGSSDTVEHVGIYVGGGQVIHASSSRDQVEYGSLDMYPIVSIRRIIA